MLCDKVFPTGESPQAQGPCRLGFWGSGPLGPMLAQGKNESLLANFVFQCYNTSQGQSGEGGRESSKVFLCVSVCG